MTNLSDYPGSKFVRTFDIEAISIPIVYNKFGDHDPNGMLYVLKKDSERIQQRARENFAMSPPMPYKEVQPLVIRANAGDEIHINFYNRLDRRASMHVQGLRYDVLTSVCFQIWVMHEAARTVPMYTVCLVRSSLKSLSLSGLTR